MARTPAEVKQWAKSCKREGVIGSGQIFECLFEKAEDKYGKRGIPRNVNSAIMKTGQRWSNAQRGTRLAGGRRRRSR